MIFWMLKSRDISSCFSWKAGLNCSMSMQGRKRSAKEMAMMSYTLVDHCIQISIKLRLSIILSPDWPFSCICL